MRARLMTSAIALTGAIAFAGVSHAQDPTNFQNGNTLYWDYFNNNSDNSTDDSNNDNSDNSTDNSVYVEDSYNTDDSYNMDDSNNDNSDHSTDNSVYVEDSYNTDDSYNTADSYNDYSKTATDSFNDNSSHSYRMSMNYQELDASVSDIGFNFEEDDRGAQNGRIRTGDIRQDGGSFAGFAGIQTVSNNTGLASIGQSATAISANANVTFGGN